MLNRSVFSRTVRTILNVKDSRPSKAGAAVLVGLVGLFGQEATVPSAVWATHETDHRFSVSGYVRDKEGKPVGDARVQVRDLRDQKVESVTTYTDNSGYYKVVLHLHNDNAGDAIQITVREEKARIDETTKIRAEFDPEDRRTERQRRVDVGPVPVAAEQGWLWSVAGTEGPSYWVYAIAGLLVSGAIGVAIAWSRRRQVKVAPKRRAKKR